MQQIPSVLKPGVEAVDGPDNPFQLRPLLAQGLSPLGSIPDGRVLQFAQDLGQPFLLVLVVKDTPSETWYVP
ncbi:MAG: hypothetical protein A2514_09570 [Gammaproteobacteria bacterium RIFOXYD12_FULL_61_37]|nr:MAG: hypothetical protein A2514_09570 [Gammaproteobacteria bacterium RIFOXYD12_FULL_61_37]